jgi:hypothetical protein
VKCGSLTKEGRDRLRDGITSTEPVTGLTHNFYRYPARFSPDFVRSVIQEFTNVGDVVYDPFMGGGTTLVESASLGRHSVGTDISSLATFIARVKTTIFSDRELVNIEAWARNIIPLLTISTTISKDPNSPRSDYQRNINCRSTWRIRKLLEMGLSAVELLDHRTERLLARCILLRTGQWALDCRTRIPSVSEFRKQALLHTEEMIDAAHEFASIVCQHESRPNVICVHRSAIGAEADQAIRAVGPPNLVLTSPPYPGLHVLYHRWQIQGRRETPAPFWIAGTLDGDGASFYTFGDRKQLGFERYFETVEAAFRSVHKIASNETRVVQMVAFSNPELQLPRYLAAMSEAGFTEESISGASDSPDGRVWRNVPGRKWYASMMGATGGSQEVVLFHRKSRNGKR